jgi:hypothetical protein
MNKKRRTSTSAGNRRELLAPVVEHKRKAAQHDGLPPVDILTSPLSRLHVFNAARCANFSSFGLRSRMIRRGHSQSKSASIA